MMSSWQVQHGQSVYRVEVKMDKPTPERAIELAYTEDELANNCNIVDDCYASGYHQEVAAILRDYADLRRKWDAVVNAEPVAWRNPESTSEDYAFSFWPSPSYCVPLIVKP